MQPDGLITVRRGKDPAAVMNGVEAAMAALSMIGKCNSCGN